MKALFIFCLLITLAIPAMTQSNSIKGHFLFWPSTDVGIYSFCIGYERLLTKKNSVQISFNKLGSNTSNYDGPNIEYFLLTPEYRKYLSKDSSVYRSVFIGVFNEFVWINTMINFQGEREDSMLVGHKINKISPGICLGKSFKITKNAYLEIFGGIKYSFITEKETYRISNEAETRMSNYINWGYRLGLNYGWRF
ncbi:MAG: DUF3575 domain-containing protein [Bacteroidota bacterium]|nr:DUF3575 domain-containing protein [Bacteroidota bacterium]